MKSWKTKNRQVILDQPPWLRVERHTVELPDGRLIPDWPWIITPDYVNVVAVTEDERFLILPHPEVADFFQRKAADYDRWLAGMRRLQASVAR